MSNQENGREGRQTLAAPGFASSPSVPASGGPGSDELQQGEAATGGERARCHPGTGNPEKAAPAGNAPARWGCIPKELRERRQWLIAVGKVPHSPFSGVLAPVNVKAMPAWLTFDEAASLAAQLGHGIGYALDELDPFTCIDLDVKDDIPPERIDLFSRVLYGFDSYAERSQSGRGLHIWCRGMVGKGLRREGVELYSQERFIVCTGDTVLDRPIGHRQDLLDGMASQMRALGTTPVALVELPPLEPDQDHWQRKANAQNGWKLRELWEGRWQALAIGDGSQSASDMALVRMLCFNNPSNEQVRRMFRASALGQRKKAQRVDYVDGMIATARAADAQRERVHAEASAAMAPGIDVEIAAYRAKWGAR
jgi:primase-polymerase (primpol)-like protein